MSRRTRQRRTRPRRDTGMGISSPSRSMTPGQKPYEWKESDIEALRELHAGRSYVAQKTDEHLIAPIAPSPSHWIKHPGEYDVYGVDYPEYKARKQMEKRSDAAQATDKALKAPLAPTPEAWAKHPERYDLPGVDTPHKTKAKPPRVNEQKIAGNPMGTPGAAKDYLADVVETYRKRLGVKGGVKLRAQKGGYPARIIHSPDGKPSQIVVNYRHFGIMWEHDPALTKRYLEYAVAHEMAHQKQIEELSFNGARKADKEAKVEVEVDADHRAFKAMGVSEDTLKKTLDKLAKKTGGEHVRNHPGFKGKPDLSRFEDHTTPEKPRGMAAPPAARWYGVELDELKRIPGIGDKAVESLKKAGYRDVGQVWGDSCSGWKNLEAVDGIGEETAKSLFRRIEEHVPPKKAEKPREEPRKRTVPELRDQMKVTYGKALGKIIPAATQHEKELIAEKAIAEEWIKPDDTAKAAMAKVTEKAKAELVKLRQEKAAKDREEQLKALKERADQAQAKKSDEQRLRDNLAKLREDYGVQYETYLRGALSQWAANKRDSLYTALKNLGYSDEEAGQISHSFNDDAVKRIQAEALAKTRKETMELADDIYGEAPELWEEAVQKTRAAEAAERHAKEAVEAAYSEALGSIRDRTEPPKAVTPIQPKPTVKTSSESYDFYADPGHGWLRVPLKRLEELGIENDISPYSYVKGGYAYLEEDSDAVLFTDTLESLGVKVGLREHTANRESSIRGYPPYRKPKEAENKPEADSPYNKAKRIILAAKTPQELDGIMRAVYQEKGFTDEEKTDLAEYARARHGNMPDQKQQGDIALSPTEEARKRYDAIMADRIPRGADTWRLNLRKALLDQGFTVEEANAISGRLTAEAVHQNQSDFILQNRMKETPAHLTPEIKAERDSLVAVQNEYERLKKEALEAKKTATPKPIEPGVPSLKKATAFSPEYSKDSGMYEVEVYDPDKREKTTRRFSTPDKAEQYRRLINENPGWPLEGFKERQGNKQGNPKYMIIARNVKSRGDEAIAYTVYDRDKSDRNNQNVVNRGTIEYKEAPGKQKIVEDLILEAPKGPSYEVDFTVTPHWTPALSEVERIAPSSPSNRNGKWMVWFKNRVGRDMDPREGMGTRSFDTYDDALGFAREGRGRYNQGDFEREAIWLTMPEPDTLPSELESFPGKQDKFLVDPRPRYEGTWNPDRKAIEYRWVWENQIGGKTHTLDELREERQKGEWKTRDRVEAAKSSRTITRKKGMSSKAWDHEAQPLVSAVIFPENAIIEADDSTVTYGGMDVSHVAMMILKAPNDMGIPEGKYEAADFDFDKRVTHLRHPKTVKWDNVERSLSVSNENQKSYIRYEKVTDYKNRYPEPRITFKATAELDMKALKKAADEPGVEHIALVTRRSREAYGDTFTYEAEKDEKQMVTHGEGADAWESEENVRVPVSGTVGEVKTVDEDEVKAVYTTSYLSDSLDKLIRAGFRDATLEYATDMPLKITAKRDDGAKAEFYLAPCIGV